MNFNISQTTNNETVESEKVKPMEDEPTSKTDNKLDPQSYRRRKAYFKSLYDNDVEYNYLKKLQHYKQRFRDDEFVNNVLLCNLITNKLKHEMCQLYSKHYKNVQKLKKLQQQSLPPSSPSPSDVLHSVLSDVPPNVPPDE